MEMVDPLLPFDALPVVLEPAHTGRAKAGWFRLRPGVEYARAQGREAFRAWFTDPEKRWPSYDEHPGMWTVQLRPGVDNVCGTDVFAEKYEPAPVVDCPACDLIDEDAPCPVCLNNGWVLAGPQAEE